MAYLAIARKYRPATFQEMVGQDHVTRTLRNAITRSRIHHAYLFTGARGVGKTTAARAFARSLNCAEGPTPDPCGVCTSCKEILAGTSTDLIEIDGASNNSVDDVRELRESVRYPPTHGRFKIYLVDEVHMLSNAAFNALLKTLEEPPPHVVFLFATTEPEKLPETILSRVQRFDFKRIAQGGVVDRLRTIAQAEGVTISDGALRLIARAGEGSMRDAQSLLDKVISFGGTTITDAEVADTLGLVDQALLHGMLEGLLQGDPGRCIDVIAQVYDYGYELGRFTAELLELLRNATFLGMSESARRHVDLAEEEKQFLIALTEGVPPDVLTRLFTALLETHEQVARAARPRVVLEMAVARLATVRPVLPVGALVARLEQMERRLRHTGAVAPAGQPPRRTSGPTGRANRAPATVRAPTPPPRPTRRTAQMAPTATDAERWAAFTKALDELDPPAEGLAEGVIRRDGATVVVTLPAGRKIAAARRSVARTDVLAALQDCFDTTQIRVEESLASRSGADPRIEHDVLTDPTCQKILRLFQATLEAVEPSEG